VRHKSERFGGGSGQDKKFQNIEKIKENTKNQEQYLKKQEKYLKNKKISSKKCQNIIKTQKSRKRADLNFA